MFPGGPDNKGSRSARTCGGPDNMGIYNGDAALAASGPYNMGIYTKINPINGGDAAPINRGNNIIMGDGFLPISHLRSMLSFRAYTSLRKAQIFTVSDLLKKKKGISPVVQDNVSYNKGTTYKLVSSSGAEPNAA